MTEKDTTKNLTEQTTPQSEVVDEGKKTRKHRTRKTRALTGLLAATLLASCGKPTARDVAKQGEKVEVIKESIEQYIKYRKEVVKRYNKLVRDSRADPDNVALKEQKAELRDEIKETDKKIERLGKKFIKQTKKYNETVIESIDGTYGLDDEIPEDTYDFMLGMIE